MRIHIVSCLSFFAACGGKTTPDAAPPVDNGFNKPTDVLHANNEPTGATTPTDLGVADFSCLNTASTDMATTVAVSLSTTVKDFQSHNLVPNAMVTAFQDINYTTPFDTQTADENAAITFTVPIGTKRFGFEMNGTGVMPTFLHNQYLDPSMATQTLARIQSVSDATAETLPALIGETRMQGTGVVAGTVHDCQGNEVSNFIGTVSSTQGTATLIDGAESYYFSAGIDLPVHHQQQESSSGDGIFMVIQLPPQNSGFVQAWGYVSADDLAADKLSLIAELAVPVLADSVVTGDFDPLVIGQ
jgi:hypothetical protein